MRTASKFFLFSFCAASLSAVSAIRASLLEDTCEYNTYMCCWDENNGDGMQDNTDVCRVVDSPKVGETREFPGDSEGDIHCHGMVWADGASLDSFILPLFKFVRNYDHKDARGYYGRIPGSHTCECIEKMPVVSRADCTTFSPQGLVACENNDLRTHYENEMNSPGGNLVVNLVETCDNEKAESTSGSSTSGEFLSTTYSSTASSSEDDDEDDDDYKRDNRDNRSHSSDDDYSSGDSSSDSDEKSRYKFPGGYD